MQSMPTDNDPSRTLTPRPNGNIPFRTKHEQPDQAKHSKTTVARVNGTSHTDTTNEPERRVLLVEDNELNMKVCQHHSQHHPRRSLPSTDMTSFQILENYAKRLCLAFDKAINGREAVDAFEADPFKYALIWMGKAPSSLFPNLQPSSTSSLLPMLHATLQSSKPNLTNTLLSRREHANPRRHKRNPPHPQHRAVSRPLTTNIHMGIDGTKFRRG